MTSFHRGDWIGLAQAIGGVLAVAAAFLVNWLQARAHARSQRREMLERLDALAKVVGIAKLRAGDLHSRLLIAPATNGVKFVQIPQLEKIDVAFAAVEGLSINNAPSARSVSALIDAKTAIKHCVGILPQESDFYVRSGQFMPEHEGELKHIVDLLTEAEAQIRYEWHRLRQKT